MDIRELMRQDYAAITALAERMAPRFPAGSAERARWHRIAENYGQLARDLAVEQAPADGASPALREVS